MHLEPQNLRTPGASDTATDTVSSGFGPIELMLSCQESGQGVSECLHNDETRISTKTRNRLGDQVKEELAEVKMSMIRKRSQDDNQKKTSQTMT